MVDLRRMTEDDVAAVLRLRVHERQRSFVEPIAETLADAGRHRDNHLIVHDARIVGFFQIDTANPRRFASSPARELELHEVFLDADMQGKGIGTAFIVALAPYVRAHYADWPYLALSVNCRNSAAYKLYVHGGFRDSGEIYPHGRSGPQHVMRRRI